MATLVEITWSSTDAALPAGSTDDDHFLVSLDGSGHYEIQAALDDGSANIPDVAPGTYTASVQAKAADDTNVGDAAFSAEFEILDMMVHVRVPAGVSGRAVP